MLREPWRTRLLFLSFAVNLVAIPMAAVPYYRHYVIGRPALPPGVPRPEIIIDHMADVLAPEDGKVLRDTMEPHVESIQAARVHMEAARRAMIGALTDTPFDADAARAAGQRWQTSWTAWAGAMGDAMIDASARLSPDGRVKLRESTLRRRAP